MTGRTRNAGDVRTQLLQPHVNDICSSAQASTTVVDLAEGRSTWPPCCRLLGRMSCRTMPDVCSGTNCKQPAARSAEFQGIPVQQHLGPNARQRAQRLDSLRVRHVAQGTQPGCPAARLRPQQRHAARHELGSASGRDGPRQNTTALQLSLCGNLLGQRLLRNMLTAETTLAKCLCTISAEQPMHHDQSSCTFCMRHSRRSCPWAASVYRWSWQCTCNNCIDAGLPEAAHR